MIQTRHTIPPAAPSLIDQLLAEQRDLSAVARFARRHERREFPSQATNYRDLIPLTAPEPGQQYAFEVDLDKCSGCKACVTACHSLNGLEPAESWRQVGLLIDAPRSATDPPQAFSAPHQQHVTSACHHCVDPGCLNGCPVLAYEKHPVTGIVRHLDDQCIGCRYCVMKCPYEVPKYSRRLGIVRKCDMCSNRLAIGEAPACVQACPTAAIRITRVETESVTQMYRRSDRTSVAEFLPDSPDATITLPTTRYLSKRAEVPLVAADHNALRLDPPHWPLVIMLVLTQAAVGMFLAAVAQHSTETPETRFTLVLTAFALLTIGLAAAALHLGQPLKAWRAFLGWRKSWLSRELVAFNLFAAMAAASMVFPRLVPLAALAGVGAVAVSAMVYVDTGRPFWSARRTFGNFLGTTVLLGFAFKAAVLGWTGARGASSEATRIALGVAITWEVALALWRIGEWRFAVHRPAEPTHSNGRVLRELLSRPATAHMLLAAAFAFVGVLAILRDFPWALSLAAALALGSEIIGRYLFFAASASKLMPGGIKP